MKKIILVLIISIIGLSSNAQTKGSGTIINNQDTCLKITRLTPIDTVLETDYYHISKYLLESIKDTFEINRVSSSKDYEQPKISKYGYKIYPKHPDTLYINSFVLYGKYPGVHDRQTYIWTTSNCCQIVHNDYYISDSLPPTKLLANHFWIDPPKPYVALGPFNDIEYRIELKNIGENNLKIKDVRCLNADIKILNCDKVLTIKKKESGYLSIHTTKSNSGDKLSIEITYNDNQKLIWAEP